MQGIEQAIYLRNIYDHFNRYLFDHQLENKIYLGFSYKLRTEGMFLHDKWDDSKKQSYHEILVDENLLNEDSIYWLAVLVHQMAHLWQHQHGLKKKTKNYHDKEFVDKMQNLGLIIESGYSNEQSINHDGLFMQVAKELIDKGDDLRLLKPRNVAAQLDNPLSKNGKKFKFICPECRQGVEGKYSTNVKCGDCDKKMERREPFN
ncbi:SprT-like domain-containing protein [Nostoc sp. MS1]|uniref:SprT-like domain-containing protein n=1 Tax=Nostoc sp. MS1 TaxID=2764711 RepID=UPI001CC69663|nr:SprT-like domain-containing protein [Nostoc sp. MS1]BCL38350.1 hypothetical protein NSMS1_47970 [Nostoc sp. MS1]